MTEVLLERVGNVAVIVLNAPERRNAFTTGMVEELISVCEEIDSDPSYGAAVVRANGASFCAGAHRDILNRASLDPASAENYAQTGFTYQAFVRVGELEVPTIAAVKGHAVGAGANLMLATDLRIVAVDARIITFGTARIHPGGGHFALLGRLGAREAAAAMNLFGEEIGGLRAVELHLAWEAVASDRVEARALELASRAAADPELSRKKAASMKLELGPPPMPWAAALEMERSAQMWSLRRLASQPTEH